MNKIISSYIDHSMLMYRTVCPTPMHAMEHFFFTNGNGVLSDGFKDGFPVYMLDRAIDFEAARKRAREKLDENFKTRINQFGSASVIKAALNAKFLEDYGNELLSIELAEPFEYNVKDKSMSEYITELFRYNDKQYTEKMRGRTTDYRQYCDGFPYGFPYTQYASEPLYRYVPLAEMARAGMNRDLYNFAMSFIVGTILAEANRIAEEKDPEYKAFMKRRIDSFLEFRYWFGENAVLIGDDHRG